MSSVKANREPDDHVFQLIDRAMRVLRDEMTARLPVTDDGDLRASHRRLLSMVPADGIRVTDLAARAGMTAQALGEFARKLQAQGLLEFTRDPSDGRVRRLVLTASGRQAEREGDTAIREMEADLRERMGARDWDRLRAVLSRLGSP